MTIAATPNSSASANLALTGVHGPIDLLGPAECALLHRYFDDDGRPAPIAWSKGLAVADRVVYEVATRPALLALLTELLGPNVMLWGAQVVDRDPGQLHPWHTDIESSAADGRHVSVWIGLHNTSLASAPQLIGGSHLLGRSLQELASEQGIPRDGRTAEAALALVRSEQPEAPLLQYAMHDGQALLFDGRTIHGSLNQRISGRRRALVLQYAAAGSRIRVPDWNHLDWPFVFKDTPLPPVIEVAGKAGRRQNRVVRPPPRSGEGVFPLASLTAAIPWPLPRDLDRGWRPHPLFRGSTPVLRHLGCHISVLEPGHSPHPPHAHFDEELLIVLEGEADIVIAGKEDDPAPRVERLCSGDMVYYPSYQFHTIRCIGPAPVHYVMYRWQSAIAVSAERLGLAIFRAADLPAFEAGRGFSTRVVFEGATGFLRMLHAHWSCAEQGGGYAAHEDAHDVALLLFSGSVTTMGRTVAAPAVVFYPAGATHGLRGAGSSPAKYLTLEFHGPHGVHESMLRMRWRSSRRRLARLATRVRRKLSRLFRALR